MPFLRDMFRKLIEDRLDKLQPDVFVNDAMVQVDHPYRADRDLIFHVTDVDAENDLVYLDDGGYVSTIPDLGDC